MVMFPTTYCLNSNTTDKLGAEHVTKTNKSNYFLFGQYKNLTNFFFLKKSARLNLCKKKVILDKEKIGEQKKVDGKGETNFGEGDEMRWGKKKKFGGCR